MQDLVTLTMAFRNKLPTLTLLIISLLSLFATTTSVKFITFDLDKFSLDSKLFSEINDTADCEKYLELTPQEGTQFGDILIGEKRIVRPSTVSNRRVMVCLAGQQIDQVYIKSIRILDDSDREEKVYIYTRTQ